MTTIPYVWSDVWLLLSVITAGKSDGATLEDIVSIGDAINHAIFTFHEVDGGLARLVRGGFVTIDGERVLPTGKARQAYESVHESVSFSAKMEALERKIGAAPFSSSHDPNRADSSWSLGHFTRDDLSRAYARYHQQFDMALRNFEKEG